MIQYPDYSNCLVNFSNSLLSYYGAATHHTTLPQADVLLSKNPRHLVFIVLDGLGTAVLERYLPEDSFLRRHLLLEFLSVFPPTTTAALTSIESGLEPIEHGWLGWSLYFPEEDKVINAFYNTIKETDIQAVPYHAAQKHFDYKSIFSQIDKTNSASVNRIYPFGKKAFPVLDNWINEIERVVHDEKNRSFTLAYWGDPDYTLHSLGSQNEKVRFLVKELDEKIETTYNVVVDNPLEIDFSFIEKVKTFIFNTDNPFILTLSIDIGTEEIPNIVDVPIEVTSMFRLDPSENFLATLSKIVISTTSVNGSKVNCRIYGEE